MFSAYYNDIVVGGVCCRVDKTEDGRRLYIMTLGCLAPYRRLGIGKKFILTEALKLTKPIMFCSLLESKQCLTTRLVN